MAEEIEERPRRVEEKIPFEEMWDVISREADRIWIAEQVRLKMGQDPMPGEVRKTKVMTAACVLLEVIMRDPDGFRHWAAKVMAGER